MSDSSCLKSESGCYTACLDRLSGNLRRWRQAQNRKIAEVAAAFGVATSTWGHWERGRCLPSGENLCLLSEFTGIAIQHLLCPNADRCPFTTGNATGE